MEYRLLTRNAGWRWFHAAGRLSRRPDGSPITFVYRKAAIDAGMNGHIAKPIDVEKLLELLRDILRR